MTGLERNSDHVIMASYAPLLVNLNHRAWNPDLINFDSSRWYGLPGYYVQQMFAENRGDTYLPVEVRSPIAETGAAGGIRHASRAGSIARPVSRPRGKAHGLHCTK